MKVNKVWLTTKRLISDNRNSFIWMLIASLIVGLIMIAIFPSIKESSEEMLNYAEVLPEDLLKAFGITALDMTDFDAYISTEYFSFFWAMVFLPFIISWATLFAKNAENGTLGLQLSYPISRVQVTISHLLFALLASFLTAVVMVWVTGGMTVFIDEQIDTGNWMVFTGLVALFLGLVSSFSIMLSVIIRKRSAVVGIMAAAVIGSYFVNVISRLYEDIESIKYLSIFHYFGDAYIVLSKGELQEYALLYFSVFIILFAVIALGFSKKIELPKG